MDLIELLEEKVICGDGAMGTLLMDRGIPASRCFEELCVSNPEMVSGIHTEYLDAGADIIETNSFGANAIRLAKFGLEDRVNEINWTAAQLAVQAARGRNAFVAASVGPLGITRNEADASGIDRAAVFREQIGALLDGGARVVLLETFQDIEELKLAIHVKQELHHCPVIASLAFPESGRLAGGQTVVEAFAELQSAGADIVSLNCVSGPRAALRLLGPASAELPIAVYPNAGRPRYFEGRYVYEASAAYFAETGIEMVAAGARLVGGCCGTTPEHIAALAPAIRNLTPARNKQLSVSFAELPDQTPSGPPTILDRIREGKTVIVTELDPPKSLSLDRYYHAAKELADAGSDTVTLADNSLAILRVSNLAVGAELRQRGIEPLLHISCRDRNILGLQSELLGMAALGIRHVLPLTGDPAKVGDHPGAKSVYDATSIQLIEIIKRLNEGFTQSGTDIKRRPGFVIGCTFNPNARNLDAQVSRLERKVAAGAQYAMTQPVFDVALVEETARRTAHLGIPVFVGVWPLLNGRQARFLHNEVPGISIPDRVMTAMDGMEGPDGRKAGVEIAKEVTRAVLANFPGIYLITPFQVYETTAELAQFVRSR